MMRVGFGTLKRTISALVIALLLVAGMGLEVFAKGQKGRGNRADRGRHTGWTRGKHKGWDHSRSRHVRDDDRWDTRRRRRAVRRARRDDRRDDRRDARRWRRRSFDGTSHADISRRRALALRARQRAAFWRNR